MYRESSLQIFNKDNQAYTSYKDAMALTLLGMDCKLTQLTHTQATLHIFIQAIKLTYLTYTSSAYATYGSSSLHVFHIDYQAYRLHI